MLEALKQQVYEANLELVSKGMVIYTWGNVSGIDRGSGLVVIKPSGVNYDSMKPDDMVVVDLASGKTIEGSLRPSSDTPTHLELYRAFEDIGGITHTHSVNAVAFAQAGLSIPALGTTHADYFYGDIPCTARLSEEDVAGDYEANTGKEIVKTFIGCCLDPAAIPGVLVNGHGPFAWGKSPAESVYHAVVMETVAEMALKTLSLNDISSAHSNEYISIPQYVLDKHYTRKHGPNAYYGQKDPEPQR